MFRSAHGWDIYIYGCGVGYDSRSDRLTHLPDKNEWAKSPDKFSYLGPLLFKSLWFLAFLASCMVQWGLNSPWASTRVRQCIRRVQWVDHVTVCDFDKWSWKLKKTDLLTCWILLFGPGDECRRGRVPGGSLRQGEPTLVGFRNHVDSQAAAVMLLPKMATTMLDGD